MGLGVLALALCSTVLRLTSGPPSTRQVPVVTVALSSWPGPPGLMPVSVCLCFIGMVVFVHYQRALLIVAGWHMWRVPVESPTALP